MSTLSFTEERAFSTHIHTAPSFGLEWKDLMEISPLMASLKLFANTCYYFYYNFEEEEAESVPCIH